MSRPRVIYEPPPIRLGPPPWPTEDLLRAANTNFEATMSALAAHPAHEVVDLLASIESVLRMFRRSGREVLSHIRQFHEEVHFRQLFDRNRRQERQEIEDALQEQFYLFAASAMTLVDQTRLLSRRAHIPGYRERIEADFTNNPRHRLIQELRVDMIHIKLQGFSQHLRLGGDDERSTSFRLTARDLPRLPNYHASVRQLLAASPDGVDLSWLVSQYMGEVDALHDWLSGAIDAAHGANIRDLRRCKQVVAGVGSRWWWRLLLTQVVIGGGRDPYSYLDRWLTKQELAQVGSLPRRSKQQVDLIVELIDEHHACDEELRGLVYKAFGVDERTA